MFAINGLFSRPMLSNYMVLTIDTLLVFLFKMLSDFIQWYKIQLFRVLHVVILIFVLFEELINGGSERLQWMV